MADAPITDKFGTEIHDGDTVEFVFGGDPFTAEVTDSGLSTHGVPHIAATITVTIPAGSVRVVPKDTPRQDAHTDAQETTTPPDSPVPTTSTPRAEEAADAAQDRIARNAATETQTHDTHIPKPTKSSSTKGSK